MSRLPSPAKIFSLSLPMLLLLLAPARLASQQESNPETPQAQATQVAQPAPEEEVKGFTLPPEKYQQAVEYARARYRLYFISFVYGLLVYLLILGWRLAPRFRDWAERASRRRFVQVLIFTPLLLLTVGALALPTDIYGQYLSKKYDQSIQSWPSWFWDWTKAELLGIVIGVFLIWILYGVIRRSPRRWWFYFWLASLPIILFLVFIGPYVIQPLFFDFEPLADSQPELVAEVSQVVERAGMEIPPERMFLMEASAKTKSVNAYVAGLGASKRVVFWDTILEKMTREQALFIFGHEMGHYVLAHIVKFFVFLVGLLLIFLYLGYRLLHWALGRWGERWAVRGVEDYASLPVLMLFLWVLSFLASPAVNTFSRYYEHQADTYGLEVVHGIIPDSGRVAAEAFQKLGEINLADPDPHPFIKVWLYSHPPLDERIRFAQTYDPWSKGEPPQFVPGE
ncbi:M48 family metallopeptidase [Acidobacteriia bacterium AH_259_A11_L15]|nr:M48 family metallopeptidase [Acidobacteriia bacterium AH_259_A11_L15]